MTPIPTLTMADSVETTQITNLLHAFQALRSWTKVAFHICWVCEELPALCTSVPSGSFLSLWCWNSLPITQVAEFDQIFDCCCTHRRSNVALYLPCRHYYRKVCKGKIDNTLKCPGEYLIEFPEDKVTGVHSFLNKSACGLF